MKNCILLHLYYQDLWPEFWSYLKDIKDENTDLYVTITASESEYYKDIKDNSTDVFVIENKGMDLGGFIYAYNKIKHIPYKTITKIHGKKGHGYQKFQPYECRKYLCECLISSKRTYNDLLQIFEADNRLYMVGSKPFYRKEHNTHPFLIDNLISIDKINEILDLKRLEDYEFIAGTMFMVSKSYLDLFFNNKEMDLYQILTPDAPLNGSLAHALERLIGAQINSLGGKIESK